MKQPIILIGGGGHCISSVDVIEQTGLYEIIGILDKPEKADQKVLGYSIIGTDNDIDRLVKECPNFLITVGQIKSSVSREVIFEQIKLAGGNLPVIISPTAQVSRYSKIGEGTIVMHQVLINANANIGKCCILNSKSLIEHEAFVGDFCHISTGAVVNGQVHLGNHCFAGSNSVVMNNIHITDDTIIGAGSIVSRDIEFSGTYFGQPAHKIR